MFAKFLEVKKNSKKGLYKKRKSRQQSSQSLVNLFAQKQSLDKGNRQKDKTKEDLSNYDSVPTDKSIIRYNISESFKRFSKSSYSSKIRFKSNVFGNKKSNIYKKLGFIHEIKKGIKLENSIYLDSKKKGAIERKNIYILSNSDNLFAAVKVNDFEKVVELLCLVNENRVELDIRCDEGLTALHHAILNNNYIITKYLLHIGANKNIPTNKDETPLILACKYGYSKLARLLIENGADLEACDQNGYNFLQIAYKQGHIYLIYKLLSYNIKKRLLISLMEIVENEELYSTIKSQVIMVSLKKRNDRKVEIESLRCFSIFLAST